LRKHIYEIESTDKLHEIVHYGPVLVSHIQHPLKLSERGDRRINSPMKRSEEAFQLLANAMPQLVWRATADGETVYFNSQRTRYRCYPGAADRCWRPHIFEADQPQSELLWRSALSDRHLFETEHRLYMVEGPPRWHLTRALFVEVAGAPQWIGTSTDIHDLKSTQERLAHNEGFTRRVLDNLFAFVGVLDTKGTLMEANQAPLSAAGLESTDVIGKPFWECYWWSYDPRIQAHIREAVAEALQGRTVRYDIQARVLHGNLMWIDFQLSPLRDESGRITHLIASATDLTDRRAAEAELLAANAKFYSVFNQSGIYEGILDLDGYLREINELAAEGCGYTKEGVLDQLFWETPWWRHSEIIRCQIRTAVDTARGGVVFRDELTYRKADDSECVVDFSMHPIRDEEGVVRFLHPTGIDVTEQRRSEEKLKDADKRKDEFLATLAHELRNPLSPISTGLEVLDMNAERDDMRDVIRVMQRQVGYLVDLVDDLLDLSRIRVGKITLKRDQISMQEVIESAVAGCRPFLDERHHQLQLEMPDDPIMVEGDQTRLIQIVSNLLSNAFKYTEPGGRVKVTLTSDDRNATVEVSDTGVGIERDDLENIWDMFAQVRDTLEKAQGGLGIGLSLVKNLVELHQGTVSAESAGRGLGSTFRVTIPHRLVVDSPHGHTNPLSQKTSQKKILVVDDNEDIAHMLARLLKMKGHDVQVAFSGGEALEAAQAYRPDAIFCDVGLPGMNGYQVAETIRQTDNDVLLVAITGWGRDEDKEESRRAGFNHHLTKPFTSSAIEEILAALR